MEINPREGKTIVDDTWVFRVAVSNNELSDTGSTDVY